MTRLKKRPLLLLLSLWGLLLSPSSTTHASFFGKPFHPEIAPYATQSKGIVETSLLTAGMVVRHTPHLLAFSSLFYKACSMHEMHKEKRGVQQRRGQLPFPRQNIEDLQRKRERQFVQAWLNIKIQSNLTEEEEEPSERNVVQELRNLQLPSALPNSSWKVLLEYLKKKEVMIDFLGELGVAMLSHATSSQVHWNLYLLFTSLRSTLWTIGVAHCLSLPSLLRLSMLQNQYQALSGSFRVYDSSTLMRLNSLCNQLRLMLFLLVISGIFFYHCLGKILNKKRAQQEQCISLGACLVNRYGKLVAYAIMRAIPLIANVAAYEAVQQLRARYKLGSPTMQLFTFKLLYLLLRFLLGKTLLHYAITLRTNSSWEKLMGSIRS